MPSIVQHFYAQTNLQLFNQLTTKGFSREDTVALYRCYKVAMDLFSSQFRPSGKTFISHLVGTASILCHNGASCRVIGAGLLHAAYSHGQFPQLQGKGITTAKRIWMKRLIGDEIEDYIARYTHLKWNGESIPKIHKQISQMDKIYRDILFIRLANELEEHLDMGLRYCGTPKGELYRDHNYTLIIEMADSLGFHQLSSDLARVVQLNQEATIWTELTNPLGRARSGSLAGSSSSVLNQILQKTRSVKDLIRSSRVFSPLGLDKKQI